LLCLLRTCHAPDSRLFLTVLEGVQAPANECPPCFRRLCVQQHYPIDSIALLCQLPRQCKIGLWRRLVLFWKGLLLGLVIPVTICTAVAPLLAVCLLIIITSFTYATISYSYETPAQPRRAHSTPWRRTITIPALNDGLSKPIDTTKWKCG